MPRTSGPRNIYLLTLLKSMVIFKLTRRNDALVYLNEAQCKLLLDEHGITVGLGHLVKMFRRSGFTKTNFEEYTLDQLTLCISSFFLSSVRTFADLEQFYAKDEIVKSGYVSLGKKYYEEDIFEIRQWVAKEIDKLVVIKAKDESSPKPSIGYNFPLRPNCFIGRETKLKAVHDFLTREMEKNILLISGIGGMGKTTLVQEYIYREGYRNYFQQVINIQVSRNLKQAFIAVTAAALGISLVSLTDPEQQLLLVINSLRSCPGKNLFVIDNINEADKDELVEMQGYFNSTNWKFLITTRTAPDNFEILYLDELSTSDAYQLFSYHYLPLKADPMETGKLLAFIQQHTLMTELLAKIGKKKGYGIDKLMDNLKKNSYRDTDLQRRIVIGEHARNTKRLSQDTIHHYILSLFEPGELKEDYKNILRFFSILPAEDLHIADIKTLCRIDTGLANGFEDDLDELMQCGWLNSKYDGAVNYSAQHIAYRMHPLIQEVIYEKLTPDIDNCRPLVLTISEILSDPGKQSQKFQTYAKSVIHKLNILNQKSK